MPDVLAQPFFAARDHRMIVARADDLHDIVENRKGFSCWSREDPGCGFVIWKREKGHDVTREEAVERIEAARAGAEPKVPAPTG